MIISYYIMDLHFWHRLVGKACCVALPKLAQRAAGLWNYLNVHSLTCLMVWCCSSRWGPQERALRGTPPVAARLPHSIEAGFQKGASWETGKLYCCLASEITFYHFCHTSKGRYIHSAFWWSNSKVLKTTPQ